MKFHEKHSKGSGDMMEWTRNSRVNPLTCDLESCLFDLILYVPLTIFELNRDGSSWVEPVLSYGKCVLLKDHNAVTPVRMTLSLGSWVMCSASFDT